MVYIFVGMAFSGIVGRLALLAHRGGLLLEDNAQKSDSVVILELFGLIVGIFADRKSVV